MTIEDLKKDLKTKKPIFGSDRVIKELKIGKLNKIYLASNCKDEIKADIKHYAKLSDIKVIELEETNEDLGVICKKPFNISVISF
ncbi:MAG: ribosomal L7Ae/L30e/S12e/Gadd45 family protein [Nanoarchaeota archaeon]|nr:ribosomal L7Ae/L30e/S12e/Gadd45 family protein [Nanoarchaeota archaeon]MBU0963354.1 ribosomal L7Ae/L30e/S12e/Gadd45 family protein [Nanoarchaeota archaeon]